MSDDIRQGRAKRVKKASNSSWSSAYVGRVKKLGRRKHHGKVQQRNMCPFMVQMVIGDKSRDLSVVVWGRLAIEVHAQLQIGDIITIRNGALRRYISDLELHVNSVNPSSEIYVENNESLVHFSKAERIERWPVDRIMKPIKLSKLVDFQQSQIIGTIVAVVTYVGTSANCSTPHPFADQVALWPFRWIMVRDESLFKESSSLSMNTGYKPTDILIGLKVNSQEDPFFELEPGMVICLSDLRVLCAIGVGTRYVMTNCLSFSICKFCCHFAVITSDTVKILPLYVFFVSWKQVSNHSI